MFKSMQASACPAHFVGFVLTCALAGRPAAGQVYSPYEQHRSLDVAAAAQVPPDTVPSVTDGRQEQSDDPGAFDRSLSALAVAPAGGDPSAAPYASFSTTAAHRLAFAPQTITGQASTGFDSREVGAQAGGSADAGIDTSFLVNQGGAGGIAYSTLIVGRGGYFATLADLDTEDPHGGPLIIWGTGASGAPEDQTLNVPLSFLAGHRYRLQARTEVDLEILRNGPENRTLSNLAQFGFTLTVPEPAPAALLLAAVPLLLARRRSPRLP